MAAIEEAREALAKWERSSFPDVGYAYLAEALRALVAEVDRLPAPPPDDDEPELARALFRTLYDAGVSFQSAELIPRLVAAVRDVGFRRQGPITDDDREALTQAALDSERLRQIAEWFSMEQGHEETAKRVNLIADRLDRLAAGFRRQGAVDEAVKGQIEVNESKIAWTENNFLPGPHGAAAIAQYEYAIEQLREALEAAERVRSAAPATAEQEGDQ